MGKHKGVERKASKDIEERTEGAEQKPRGVERKASKDVERRVREEMTSKKSSPTRSDEETQSKR